MRSSGGTVDSKPTGADQPDKRNGAVVETISEFFPATRRAKSRNASWA